MTVVKTNPTPLSEFLRKDAALVMLPRVGDLIVGRILEKSARALIVDLGRFGTGMVYRGELKNAWEIVRNLKPGDEVHAKVLDVDNEEGYVELSLAEAGRQKAWTQVAELMEQGEPLKVRIRGSNKGGLTAEVAGLPAFLPVSQLSNEHYPKISGEDRLQVGTALQALVGEELTVKIIDANPRTEKLILSEREASEVSSREFAKNYTVGQEIEGIISGVADFGAFVRFTDNPAVEGLIHVSELAYRTVENPKEVVKVDDPVRVKIVDIRDGKISLSLKALKADPWTTAETVYIVGGAVRGTVYSFNPYGAIVTLTSDLQGQIHVTEFGSVEAMRAALTIGKEYSFTIQEVRPAERRIVLKLRA